ncbi:MAG TPA: hypothetical protein VFW95_11040, partial [Candidatus Limnocylindria bacterium]|nr:hypothetical protein [Candidatus Limnocylindria bacterium]
ATPRPTTTARPTAAPTLPPGATPRPPTPPPPAGTPGSGATGGSPVAASAGESALPSGTGGTLGGNPTASAAGGGGNLPVSGSADPNVEETSDSDSTVGVGRVVMLAVGGTLAVSGASYLAMLTLRRRARLAAGDQPSANP